LELVVLILSVNSLCHPSMQILNKNIDLHASSETSLCGGMGCIFEAKFALCSVLASWYLHIFFPADLVAEKLEWGNADHINAIVQRHPQGFDLILGADIYILLATSVLFDDHCASPSCFNCQVYTVLEVVISYAIDAFDIVCFNQLLLCWESLQLSGYCYVSCTDLHFYVGMQNLTPNFLVRYSSYFPFLAL